MRTTLEPMLALFGLGSWQVVLILLVLMFLIAAVGIAIILLLVRAFGKRAPGIATTTPPATPPVTPSGTQVMPRKCPKCGAELKADVPEGLCPACLLQRGFATEGGAPPGAPPFTPPSLAELAKLFPQLEILEVIGQGGMGAVYKARQPALDRFVALKILAPRSRSDVDFSSRFSREARALARLSHPNIVAVHDFGTVGQASSLSPSETPVEKSETAKMPVLHYFIMEFVDGPNLRQVEQAGKLTPREALQIIPQICAALQFAHDEGIVHRDIKPENVLLDKKGRVKIADFGLAKILGQEADFRLTGAGDVMGTPHYMAPEQVEKPQEVDHRADIYSLGVVFYEMLTGELPLGKFDPPSHKVQIDVRLDDVVMRSLSKSPERRYQHVSDVRTEVETIAQTPATGGAPVSQSAFAETMAARDYQLDIGRCLSRGWNLVKQNFWPIVGMNTLVVVLLAFMGSFSLTLSSNWPGAHFGSVLSLILSGPLLGGLYLYFLKLIRGERATVETVFSGFSNRFLQLFLGNFVATLLVVLGFLCLILPGIYLSTAWLFTLVLIIDKRLDFWAAMELSRKVITRHWWKFLGFAIVLFLLKLTGILFCVIGFFIAGPIVHAAFLYAYEDIFGAAAEAKARAGANAPMPPPAPARSSGAGWGIAVGAGAAIIFIAFLGLAAAIAIPNFIKARHRAQQRRHQEVVRQAAAAESLARAHSPKTIVLSWATNQLIDASNDVQTVSVRTDSPLEPGETISALVKQGTNAPVPANSFVFSVWRPENPGGSTSFSWFFGGVLGKGFGDDEAQAALDQLRANFIDTPIALTPGKLLELFSVTNTSGRVMAGYIDFERVLPAPIAPDERVEAIIHLRRFTAYSPTSPSIDYAAKLPPGYALRAVANTGTANTFTPAGPYQYHSSWMDMPSPFRPPLPAQPGQSVPLAVPQRPRFDTPQEREAQRKTLETQLQDLQDQGPISVVLGEPKLMFSTTNGSGDVWQGFLELIGPGTNEPAHDVNPITGQPEESAFQGANSTQSLSPEEQVRLIERQRIEYPPPTAPVPPPPAPAPPLVLPEVVRPDRTLPPQETRLSLSPQTQQDETLVFAEQPPVVVETFPASGARDVAPGETEIHVRFSKEMADHSWSWSSAWENSGAESVGPPHYLADEHTCVMTVRLEPGKTYAWWLNSDQFKNFTDNAGRPAVPYLLIFQTKPN